MPVVSGSLSADPNNQPDGYVGTLTVSADPPGTGCPNKTFQVSVNVGTGAVSVQVTPPPATDPNTGQPKTTGSSSSQNQQTTTPTNGPPPSYAGPSQSQGGTGQSGTGVSHSGGGQSSGTSTAIQNANQQAGPTTDPNGNPNGSSASTWSLTMTTCFPGDPECCYTITISGATDGQGNKSVPSAT